MKLHKHNTRKYVDSVHARKTTMKKPDQEAEVFITHKEMIRAEQGNAAAHGLYFLNFLKRAGRVLLVSKFALILVLLGFVIPLSAFEAHVVNVTAKIERRPASCGALSVGYWRNHEGCSQGGEGSSAWEAEIQALSGTFSSAFAATTGAQMCNNFWIPNCPSGNSVPAKLCRARAMTLGDESNVVSSRLDLNALIAGADNGSSAFDHLGLSSNSTVSEALAALEAIIVDLSHTTGQLTDVATVAERIYTFYEDENPSRPYCIYTLASPSETLVSGGGETIISEGIPESLGSLGAILLETVLPEAESSSTDETATTTPAVEEPVLSEPAPDNSTTTVPLIPAPTIPSDENVNVTEDAPPTTTREETPPPTESQPEPQPELPPAELQPALQPAEPIPEAPPAE